MIPKSRSEIKKHFNNIVAYIINENRTYSILDTKIFFTQEHYNYVHVGKNTVYFSMPAYYYELKKHAIIESREYIDLLDVTYYTNRDGDYYIVTDAPETLSILHELSHIIAADRHLYEPDHGPKFVETYRKLIRMFEII